MDCNRDEAIRAKGFAEKMMEDRDFLGARRFALKAQQLYPDLENLSKIILVCDVLCSANNKDHENQIIDWYAILKTEPSADEGIIRKQYRKLALQLHPDKNTFTGASEAFNLITEAQKVLLDRNQRLWHDMRLQAMRSPVRQRVNVQMSKQSDVRRQPPYVNSKANHVSPQCHNNTQEQQNHQSVNDSQTFWTSCPHCLTQFQYIQEVLGKKMACQMCKMNYTAFEIILDPTSATNLCQPETSLHREATRVDHPKQTAHGTPGISNTKEACQKDFFDKKHSKSENKFTSTAGENFKPKGEHSKSLNGFSYTVGEAFKPKGEPSNVGFIFKKPLDFGHLDSRFYGKKVMESTPVKSYSEAAIQKDSDVKYSESKNEFTPKSGESFNPKEKNSNVEFIIEESKDLSGLGTRIKKRKIIVSSSDSEDNKSSGNDVVGIQKHSEHSGFCTKRSTRPRESVLCDENPRKYDGTDTSVGKADVRNVKSTVAGLCKGAEDDNQIKLKGMQSSQTKDNLKRGEQDAGKSFQAMSQSSFHNKKFYECPDPDFSNFDRLRDKAIFREGQIWAVYDTLSTMPRFYALIRKVFSLEFKVQLTWLEPDPDEEEEIRWVEEGLPVSCGKFSCGNFYSAEDHTIFSHLVSFKKSIIGGTFEVYPKKGETWALFKDWSINWSGCSKSKKKYAYEFVEVMSDYATGIGVYVAFLAKVEGFSCLFSREEKGLDFVLVTAKERFRFSHRVPSFRMTGKESPNVPSASFELDPASLPTDSVESLFSDDSAMNARDVHLFSSYSKPSGDPAVEGKAKFEGNAFKKNVEENPTSERNAPVSGFEEVKDALHSDMLPTHRASTVNTAQPMAKSAQAQNNINTTPTGNQTSMRDYVESHASPHGISMDIPESEFCNFELDKSPDKFQTGQIWAIYCDEDTLPNYYGKINRIDPSPAFCLHVTWLQACRPQEGTLTWLSEEMPIGCGKFKLMKGRPQKFTTTNPFSHLLRAEPTDQKGVYDIFPKKGEVWALFRKWNPGLELSDMDGCEYDIVEVTGENDLCITVSVLEPVEGFRSVFRSQLASQLSDDALQISRAELLRFSHQIPAFRLTEEEGGRLRGFWELDAAALPNYLLHRS